MTILHGAHQLNSSQFDQLSDGSFVREPVVRAYYSCSHSTLWRWVKAGLIPPPKKIGPKNSVWNVGELRESSRRICNSTSPS